MRTIFSLLLVLYSFTLNAQKWSVQAFAGLSNYTGDLQENRYTFSQSKAALALGVGYAISNNLSLRILGTVGSIQGDDKQNSNQTLISRNLNFKSKIVDGSVLAEYDFFDLSDKKFTPYLFFGIAIFHFNPTTTDTLGNKVILRDMSTEGEGLPQYPDRKEYSLTQFSIPFGGGIKFFVTRNVSLGWEFRFHKSFTDYLDDVSKTYVDYSVLLAAKGPTAVEVAYRGDELKNGNPQYPGNGSQRGKTSKDWYYFSGITASFKIFTGEGGPSLFGRRRSAILNCPSRVY